MPDSRTDSLVQLAQDTARRITGSHTAWMAYLQTAARLYKYPYHEQLLIFAQRPQATACAGYEVWTNTMRRYVRRGAKGIALLDTSGDAPRLRYVFDVADTGELSQSRSLNLWKLSEENAQAVSLSLENGYDVPAREGLERQLRAISSQLAGACWVDRKQEIFDIVDGSFLEGYDEGAIEASFRRAASVSLEYALRSRCGLANEGRFIREDFIPVTEWNTPEAAARRLDWTFGIAYGDDYDRAKRTILEMLEADPRVLKSPAPFVALNNLGDSSVNLLARAWVASGDYWDLFFDMNERVYKRFAEVGLNIPFPQLDVHLKDETRPEEPKRTE